MPQTIILGGGIIGLSTAYYLAKLVRQDGSDGSQHTIHIVEPSPQLFASASGKAGGFIAKDWFSPAMAPLGDLSFELHRRLAEEFDGRKRWGWSESISFSLDRNASLLGSEDDSEYDSEDTASDLDSEAPPSPNVELDTTEAASTSREGARSSASTARASSEASSSRQRDSAEDEHEWLYKMTRLPAIEQKTADALAALEVKERAEAENRQRREEEKQRSAEEAKAAEEAEAAAAEEARVAEELARAEHPYWLQTPSHAAQAISDRKTTGQINPLELCEFLLEECLNMGVRMHHPARAVQLFHAEPNDPNSQTMVRLNLLTTTATGRELRTGTRDIPCDSIVLAAGCWTPEVFNMLFPNAPRAPVVEGLAGYSVVVRSKHWQPPDPNASDAATQVAGPCHAIFTSDPSGFSPEIYSRVGGDVWLGGLNSGTIPLPTRAMDAKPDPDGIERMIALARELCGEDIEVLETGVCFRPIPPTGKPTIVRVSDEELGGDIAPRSGGRGVGGGVFLATGHGPWGISLCLGTGQVLGEMILGQESSADISGLSKW